MADFDYYGADYGVERPSRLMGAMRNFGVANLAGALTSVTLTAGMAVWAIDLTFRDVSGVPVVRALEGPMRIAPEEPGGDVAPFQGLALADITSGGSAAPAPDQIVLAPPPVALDAPSLAERTAAAEPAPERPAAPPVSATEVRIDPDAVQMALSEALGGVMDTSSANGQSDEGAGGDAASMEVAGAALPATVPGIARSIRPKARPDGLRRISSLPTDAPVLAAGVQVASLDAMVPITSEVDPTSLTAGLTAGTRVVQLGAFDSEAMALGEWTRLEGRFGAYLAGKDRMIQKATSGGREFWRLRVAGFDGASDARRFCAELLARDAACIPVTVR